MEGEIRKEKGGRMIDKPPKIKRVTVWRLGKDGFEETTATLTEWTNGTEVTYDPKFQLIEKEYRARCDVCLIQLQGYACPAIKDRPGPYEEEGGCMDCQYMCRKSPVHIGVRNYCEEHMKLMNKKLGVSRE
jgi:hypothetical protein